MKVSVMECLDWNTSNKPEELASYTHTLMDAGVGLEALWTYRHNGKGHQIAAVAKRPAKLDRLLRDLGVKPRHSKCLYVAGRETASAVPGVLEKLSCAGIPVQYSDVLGAGDKFSAAIWVRDRDIGQARRALRAKSHCC
jgi:hypothetical protein